MHKGWGIAAALLAGAVACSSSHPQPERDSSSRNRTCDAAGHTKSPRISDVDLADFVYHDGAFYYAIATGSPPPRLRQRLGRVSCTIAGSMTSMSFNSPREGLAGFVSVGTPYFAIDVCASNVALAAQREGQVRVFLRQRPTNEAPSVRDRLERTCGHAATR